MSYVDCSNAALSDEDLLRAVFSYDTVTENTLINIVVGATDEDFFTCIRKGMSLTDALRLCIIDVAGTLSININTL